MKGLLKTAAVVVGLAGGCLLGFLINLALTQIPFFALALVVVLVILFVGGTGLVALFIFLWAKANGDLDRPIADQAEMTDDEQEDAEEITE